MKIVGVGDHIVTLVNLAYVEHITTFETFPLFYMLKTPSEGQLILGKPLIKRLQSDL